MSGPRRRLSGKRKPLEPQHETPTTKHESRKSSCVMCAWSYSLSTREPAVTRCKELATELETPQHRTGIAFQLVKDGLNQTQNEVALLRQWVKPDTNR